MSSQTTPFILILAIWIHLCFGISLIAHENVSRIAILTGINTITELGINHTIVGSMVVIFSIMASFALIFEKNIGRTVAITLIFPQYSLLFIAMFSDIYVLITREVMDREVNFWILFSVLNMMIGLSILHTLAVLERYWRRWIRE